MDPDFGPMTDSFDSTFQVMQTLFIVIFVVVLGLIVLATIRALRQRAANNAAPEVSAAARVADKRIELSGGGSTSQPSVNVDGTYSTTLSSGTISQRHLVTFEQASGERFELEVPANEYGLLVVGDEGSVSMKGTRYLGFTRELLR